MRTFLLGLSIVLLFIGYIPSSSAITADDKVAVRGLIRQHRRPTIGQIYSAFEIWPSHNIFLELLEADEVDFLHVNYYSPYNGSDVESIANTVREYAPKVIASLEMAYPNAVYASLGRDAVFITDVLEAFFLTSGENGRTHRLEGSTASIIPGSNTHHHTRKLINLLTTNGLDSDVFLKRPYVILDRTGYRHRISGSRFLPSSQSTYVMNAAYEHIVKKSRSPFKARRLVNFVSTEDGGSVGKIRRLGDKEDVENYFRDLGEVMSGRDKVKVPPMILGLRDMDYLADNTEDWHGSYGPIKKNLDGVYRGTISGSADAKYKLYVLAALYETFSIVADPGFLQDVKARATELGYSYDGINKASRGRFRRNLASQRRTAEALVEAERAEERRLEREALRLEMREKQETWQQLQLDQATRRTIKWASLKSTYAFDFQLASLVKDLEQAFSEEHDTRGSYRTLNGDAVQALYDEYFLNKVDVVGASIRDASNARISRYLLFVSGLHRAKKITSKDFRRLVLFALSDVDTRGRAFNKIVKAIEKDRSLAKVLTVHHKVFLTSLKRDMRAKPVYQALVRRGYLPEPDCTVLL